MRSVAADKAPLRRFEIALIASLVVNMAVWLTIASAVQYKVAAPPKALEFQRVIIDKRGHTVPKIVKRKPPPPKPKPPPKLRAPVQKPPETAHNRIVTAKPKGPPAPSNFTAPAGGNAKLGAPIDRQGTGNAVANPPKPAPPAPPPPVTPTPAPPAEQPKPAPPPPVEGPKPEPPAPAPEPPKPKGETRDAAPTHQVSVQIPDDLKSQSFKSFVRVRVTIASDGSFTVFLRSSSGNSQVDKLVIDALNQWKWKPALKDGDPVDSVQAFRFDFDIR
jgi:TonB family protein